MRPTLALLLLATALLLAGCVSVNFNRRHAHEPVPDEAVLALRDQHADLAACLDRLGAPLLVIEQPADGMALAWGWLDQLDWGINVSISIRGVSVSADYDSVTRLYEGVVLFFDADLRLTHTERGLLRDLLRARHRPALTD